MKNAPLRSASSRNTLASIILACAACASGDPSSSEPSAGDAEESLETRDGIAADDFADSDVVRSVDVSRDDDLPKVQGSGFTLIEELNLPGRKVGFYQGLDGSVFHAERGRLDGAIRSPEESGLSGSALYEALTHKPAPERLVDAEIRSGVFRRSAPRATGSSSGANEKAVPGCRRQGGCELRPHTRAEFLSEFCRPTDRYWENIWVTGDSWIKTSGTNYMQVGMLTNVGNVRYEGKYESAGDYRYIWTLVPSGYYIVWMLTNVWDADARSKVIEADGDIYDHCVNWRY